MSKHVFDVIVIGSGTSAYYALDGLNRDSQRQIAVIDERPYGGTCALRGCQPKKFLVSNGEAVAMAAHLSGRGLDGEVTTNWQALQALKNDYLRGRSEAEVTEWQKRGVTTFHGHARMISENQVKVGDEVLGGRKIILATGAVPRRSEIEGHEYARDSEYFLEMANLPKRILFIGGGYISFEFAHVAARAGAQEVVILHRSDRPLKAFDRDIVATVIQASEATHIRVVLETTPVRISESASGYQVHTSTGGVIATDLVIEATGRQPNLSVLADGRGNVAASEQGVVVNEYLQSTSNPDVYAIGDCAATPYMLAPVADEEGKTVVHNIVAPNSRTIDYSVIPSTVFTIPSIGAVGLTEEQARQNGDDFRINTGVTTRWPSARRIGEQHGAYKIIIDRATDLLIGAHIARYNAAEAINILALAMKFKIKAADLAEFMWAYPTYSSDLKYMVK